MLKSKIFVFFLTLAAINCNYSYAIEKIVVVDNKKSSFKIVLPKRLPVSLNDAAVELQKSIEISTGAKLPVVQEGDGIAKPYISLGDTIQARSAGLKVDKSRTEEYQIITKNGNLYILGFDTAYKQLTSEGGVSNGTSNGVYVFLEDYLGVHWLMPGDIGRDVPDKSTFVLEDINRREKPAFHWRIMTGLFSHLRWEPYQMKARDWANRMRVGWHNNPNSSIRLEEREYDHSWQKTVPAELFNTNPEWFAMDAEGKRMAPGKDQGLFKLETTNQELVQYYAKRAIEAMKNADRPIVYSLSPSDQTTATKVRYSLSPESKKYYDPIPPGKDIPSVSPLILKWYSDVANAVAREYPQGRLAGFIYSDYFYPPEKSMGRFPENFIPVVAPAVTYGFGMYRESHRKLFVSSMEGWARVAPKDWFYYDLPGQFWGYNRRSSSPNIGLVTPPVPDALNLIFRTLQKSKITGARFFGDSTWSNFALMNYIDAKLMWDPSLDAKALQQEWLQRAYGEQAGAKMDLFYTRLGEIFSDYFQKNPQATTTRLNAEKFRDIYGRNYPELEKLFLDADRQPMTEAQKERLGMIKDHLIVLGWRLRNMNYLTEDNQSPLKRTDLQIAQILQKDHPDIEYFPGVIPHQGTPAVPQVDKLGISRVEVSTNLSSSQKAPLPSDTLMIFTSKDATVRITPTIVQYGDDFASYILQSRKGTISSGLLVKDHVITFDAKAGEDYYFYVTQSKVGSAGRDYIKEMTYQLSVENAVIAQTTLEKKSGILRIKDANSSTYVYAGDMVTQARQGGVMVYRPNVEMLKQLYSNSQVTDLTKKWKFAPTNEKHDQFSRPGYDDSQWKTLDAGNWWQFQGFPDYRGIAWYRKTINLPVLEPGQRAALLFGAVDGHAVVNLNGKRIGEHRLGSGDSGWNKPFYFDVTEHLKPGANVIAVQVTSKAAGSSGMQGEVNLVIGTSQWENPDGVD